MLQSLQISIFKTRQNVLYKTLLEADGYQNSEVSWVELFWKFLREKTYNFHPVHMYSLGGSIGLWAAS